LVAEAAHEALELVVVLDTKSEDGCGDTLTERIPHSVALLPHRGRPAYDADMRYQQLISPDPLVLIHLEPEVVGGVQAMAC